MPQNTCRRALSVSNTRLPFTWEHSRSGVVKGHADSLIAGLEGPTSHQPFVTPADLHGPRSTAELEGSRHNERFSMRTTQITNTNELTLNKSQRSARQARAAVLQL